MRNIVQEILVLRSNSALLLLAALLLAALCACTPLGQSNTTTRTQGPQAMYIELFVRKSEVGPKIEVRDVWTRQGLVKASTAGRAIRESIALRFLDKSNKTISSAYAANPLVRLMERVDTSGRLDRVRFESDSGSVAVIAPYNSDIYKVRFEYLDSAMVIHQLNTEVLNPRRSDD